MITAAQKQSGFVPTLKNVFRRNAVGLVLTQLFALLITTFAATDSLSMKPLETMDITIDYSASLSSVLVMFSFAVSLITVYILYRELFSRRASDFLLAMPVKREAIFNANTFFCVLNIVLSYIISFAGSIFLIKSNVIYPAKFYTFDIAVFAKLFLISFLSSIAVFALFTACAAISGRKWHYFILCYFSVSGVFGAAIGLSRYIDSIWGFTLDYNYGFIVSPVASAVFSVNERLKNVPVIVIALVVQTAIVYAAGLIAFKRRRAEVAETTISGKILPFIMITVFLLSDAVTVLSFSNRFYVNLIIAFIVMILFVLIITALFYRKPFNKLTLASLAASFAITGIVVFCVGFVPKATGYVDYVPEANEVESVTVEMNNQYYDDTQSISLLSSLLSGPYYYNDEFYNINGKSYTVSTDEAKSAVSIFHKKMISDKTIDTYYNGNDKYDWDAVNRISLKYHLKNGDTVLRTYYVNASSVCNEAVEFLKTDECLKQIPPMSFENDEILFIIADFSDENKEDIQYLELGDYKTLTEAVKKDIMNYSGKDFASILNTGFDANFYNDEDFEDDYFSGDLIGDSDSLFKITIDRFSPSASKEQREKMSRMRPAEMIRYDNDYVIKNGYEVDYLLDYTDIYVHKSDKNIIKYFESLGYRF